MMTLNTGITTFSRRVVLPAIAVLTLAALPAAAAENWIACDGTVVTKDGKATSSAPSQDVYAYDDTAKAFFKYSKERKTLFPIPTAEYSDKAITWSADNASSLRWQGRIARPAMTLEMTRYERGQIMTWKQQCKPTSPQ